MRFFKTFKEFLKISTFVFKTLKPLKNLKTPSHTIAYRLLYRTYLPATVRADRSNNYFIIQKVN